MEDYVFENARNQSLDEYQRKLGSMVYRLFVKKTKVSGTFVIKLKGADDGK